MEIHVGTGICIDGAVSEVGKRIIMPPSHKGSPRAIKSDFLDSSAVVTETGRPHNFITVTCNPNWDDIVENLLPGETAHDRLDITIRVFKIKLKQIEDDLRKKFILGKVKAFIRVIEFQKRGLPHAHILITYEDEDAPVNLDDFDRISCAEISK